MFRRRRKIFFKESFELFLISCGDTGEEIGNGIIETLKDSGANIKSLLITTGHIKEKKSKIFDRTFTIDENRDGFSKILDNATGALEHQRDKLNDAISHVVPGDRNKLLIVTTGAGATGLGSTMMVLDILYKEHKLIPPVFTLLPEVFENSRVQNNVAQFLYSILYADEAKGNSIIILDNKPSLNELDESFSELAANRLQKIPGAIADLLFSSFQESLAEGYEASVSDLFEVIHTPGLSVFISEPLVTSSGSANTNLTSVLVESVIKPTSLSEQNVFECKSAFISVSNITDKDGLITRQTIIEGQRLERKFENKPFLKFINVDHDDQEEDVPMLHAIVAGLPTPPRVIQIMQLGRDNRKIVYFKERQLIQESVELDVERIQHLEEERDSLIQL